MISLLTLVRHSAGEKPQGEVPNDVNAVFADVRGAVLSLRLAEPAVADLVTSF
jgi:hypothetical protein